MLRTLRERRENNEHGFTLIELMVVVLIIAILLAIAIPTFLGAKTNANNRAAQSALRNALTAEKTWIVNSNGTYIDTSVQANIDLLNPIENAIKWTIGPPTPAALATPNNVVATIVGLVANGGTGSATVQTAVVLTAKSATGDCFYVLDDTVSLVVGAKDSTGTSYMRDVKCTLAGALPTPAVITVPNTTTVNIWASNF